MKLTLPATGFFNRSKRGLLMTGLAGWLGLAGAARAQTTVILTGGDAGQGLTLDAGNVTLAWDIQGSGSFTLQGVSFANHTIGTQFGGSFDFGGGESSADDTALIGMLNEGAWDNLGASPITFTFSGLTPNASYRFDLIQSVLAYAGREQAIVVNGSLVTIVALAQYAAYNTTFLTTADVNGDIDLLVAASGGYGGSGVQDGAILNALVLTSVAAVPEPVTYAALLGLGALGVVLWRRRVRSG